MLGKRKLPTTLQFLFLFSIVCYDYFLLSCQVHQHNPIAIIILMKSQRQLDQISKTNKYRYPLTTLWNVLHGIDPSDRYLLST